VKKTHILKYIFQAYITTLTKLLNFFLLRLIIDCPQYPNITFLVLGNVCSTF